MVFPRNGDARFRTVSVGIRQNSHAPAVRQAKRPLLEPPLFDSYSHQLSDGVPNGTTRLISHYVLASNVWTNNHKPAKKTRTIERWFGKKLAQKNQFLVVLIMSLRDM